MSFKFQLYWIYIAVMLLALSCSGGGNPAEPSVIPPDISGSRIAGDNAPGRYLWSYNEILIHADNASWEILPARSVEDHWNVLKWLEQSPCTDCFKVKDISPTPKGTLQVQIEVTHPFASPTLTGFDVRGIAMSHGSCMMPSTGLVTSTRFANEGELVNADGFTTLYNYSTSGSGPGGLQGYIQGIRATMPWPDTTLNGFKRLVTEDPLNTRNAFYAGTSVTQVYEIFKPAGAFILGYAVDASWVPPSNKPVTDPMTDFPPEANCPEPWRIEISETPVGLGLTSSGGEVVLTIDVYDHQGKLTHYIPMLECPQIFDGVISAPYQSSEPDHARFEATVENLKLAGDGLYKCFISVEDIENEGSPAWLDITAYTVYELGVGLQAPQNVEVFHASDADPALPNRKVELTWESGLETVEWYDIERRDFDYETGWFWNPVKSAPYGDTSWVDGNPRYSGPDDPIHYRISARNEAGSSPGYATDTGYPLPRGFNMALWCVADDSSGSNPVTSWERALADFNWCNEFWNRYGMNFVLKNGGNFFWVGNPEYKNLTGGEDNAMHETYGKVQTADSINVYYVNSSNSDPGRAYCAAMCPGVHHTTENIYIVMGRDSSGPPPDGIPITLSHECGHAVGRFFDIYLLDVGGDMILNDGTSCASINTWCNNPPFEAPPLFCTESGAYAQGPNPWNKNPWNLMWYSAPGKSVANYTLADAQYVYLHEWVHEFKNNYPWP